MRRKVLLTVTLISIFALAGCTKREVAKVDPLNIPIEETEPVKPAQPILISVYPDTTIKEDEYLEEDNSNFMDIDTEEIFVTEKISIPNSGGGKNSGAGVSNGGSTGEGKTIEEILKESGRTGTLDTTPASTDVPPDFVNIFKP